MKRCQKLMIFAKTATTLQEFLFTTGDGSLTWHLSRGWIVLWTRENDVQVAFLMETMN